MATPTKNFIPELWSQELMEELKRSFMFPPTPKRDKASQLLRDAALGHPEYPENLEIPERLKKLYTDWKKSEFEGRTATEVRMRNEMYEHQLDAYRYAIDNATLSNNPIFDVKRERERT